MDGARRDAPRQRSHGQLDEHAPTELKGPCIRAVPEGAFVGQHGSWNRNPPLGYRVIFVPFANGHAVGPIADVLTGFLDEKGPARGRPVGVAIDRSGALLVADDVGNAVWRVTGVVQAAQVTTPEALNHKTFE